MLTNTEIGKRIRGFREKSGITQAKLGQLLGYTSHVPVANMESGRNTISVVQLESVANILRVPLHYLIPGLSVGGQSNALSIALRANSVLTPEEQDEILRYYELKRKQKQKTKESMLGGLNLMTVEGARGLARRHLRDLGVDKPPVDLNYALFHWNIDYDERELGEKISGFLLRDGLLRLICVNSTHTLFRKRMTIAHELGHFHLNTTEFHCIIAFGKENDSEEGLAFQYAHELLMPSDWLRANKERWQRNPVGIAQECQVSRVACEMWAQKLGLALPIELELRERHDKIMSDWRKARDKFT